MKCAYCLWPVDSEGTTCGDCGVGYHPDCWAENGGCGTFGCPAWAARQLVGAPVASVAAPAPPAGAMPVRSAPLVAAPAAAPVASPTCRACNAHAMPGDRFCIACGTPLEGSA